MYIFLDESGDLGFDFSNKNSSNYFCITLLVCYNKRTFFSFKSATKRTLLAKFNHKNTKKVTSELKGSGTTLSVKQYFYKQLSKCADQDWEIYSVIVDKVALFKQASEYLESHRLYNLLSREIMERVDFSSLNDHVQLIVDKCKGKHERSIFDYFLKTNLESKLPINVSLNILHELSHNNVGLQAVDIFCHGIVRKHALSDISWYSEFSNKIVEEIRWKPKLK
jgi:Protein of unknown function (DUF3800)